LLLAMLRSGAGRTRVKRLPHGYGPGCWIGAHASLRTAFAQLRATLGPDAGRFLSATRRSHSLRYADSAASA